MIPNAKKKSQISILIIGSFCIALISILTLVTKVEGIIVKNWLVPCIDSRIDEKINYINDKINVIYFYNRELASSDELSRTTWNKAVDQVQEEKQRKINKQ